MKVTIEFEPNELARSAASQVLAAMPEVAAMGVAAAPRMGPGTPIDAGHAPAGAGGVMAETMRGPLVGMESVPADIAATAAAIGAVSAGPAPTLS